MANKTFTMLLNRFLINDSQMILRPKQLLFAASSGDIALRRRFVRYQTTCGLATTLKSCLSHLIEQIFFQYPGFRITRIEKIVEVLQIKSIPASFYCECLEGPQTKN